MTDLKDTAEFAISFKSKKFFFTIKFYNMKNILTIAMLLISSFIFSQSNDFQLSSHILDIGTGQPAPGVTVKLEKMKDSKTWIYVDEKKTDTNGRIPDFLKSGKDNKGIYRLTFMVVDYFKAKETSSFYPFIEVVFQIEDENHYHVPITLSPFGYSTYRGN